MRLRQTPVSAASADFRSFFSFVLNFSTDVVLLLALLRARVLYEFVRAVIGLTDFWLGAKDGEFGHVPVS